MKNNKTISLALCAALVSAVAQGQTVTEVYLPQYLANGNTTGNRAPTSARLALSGLTANATYRYYVSGDTNAVLGTGAGNYFGINNTANAAGYIQGYSSGKGLNGTLMSGNEDVSANRYSEFTTDASGNYTGWFGMVPTSNARFTVGNNIKFGLLLNNGAGGTTVASTLYGTSTIRALGQGVNSGVNEGTFIVGDSLGAPGETMVLLYDNVAGTGRPIWGSWTETDGIAGTAFTLWNANVTAGLWGAYVPNDLVDGIRRVEYWDIASNTLLGAATDADGIWTPLAGAAYATANGDTTFNGGTVNVIGIVAPIPEPSAFTLMGMGALAAAFVRRARSRR